MKGQPKRLNLKYAATLWALSCCIMSLAQNKSQVIGTWAVTGNNVYLYEFADSGKVSVTSCKNKGIPNVIENGWRIAADSLFYLKEKKGKTYVEHTFKVIELTPSKMTLNYPMSNHNLEFYKIEPNTQAKVQLSPDFFIHKSFRLEPSVDTMATKISFKEGGVCTLHRNGKSGEKLTNDLDWKIIVSANNVLLIIDDFEIFAVRKINENKSELELVPYGFLRTMSDVRFLKFYKSED